MGRVTLKDFDKSGDEYGLSADASKKHSKKELAGIPKTVTVHKPENGEHIAEALAKSACGLLEKRLAID